MESGTGADGDGTGNSYTGDITSGNFTLKYFAYSVSDANDPSICEVFYYISNEGVRYSGYYLICLGETITFQGWGSVAPTSFTKPNWSTGTDNLVHEVHFEGRPKGILAGYTLLSRYTIVIKTYSYNMYKLITINNF